MDRLDALFADLLLAGDGVRSPTPGDIGDIGDKQASARVAGRKDAGDMLATSGDIFSAPGPMSPNVATVSPTRNRPQSEQRCGLSPMSPMSPAPRVHSLSPSPPTQRERPHRLTREQGDACHFPSWDDAEIAPFTARVLVFMRRGVTADDADDLAERLTLRDRDGDDRRLCVECTHLGEKGRCLAAAMGRIPGADRRLEPVQTVLHRCEAFGLRKGLA